MAFYAKLKENSIKEMLCACHFHEYCKCYYLMAQHVMWKCGKRSNGISNGEDDNDDVDDFDDRRSRREKKMF